MNFGFSHAIAASLALHGAIVLPFIVPAWPEPPEDVPILVVELKGVEAPTQSEQKVQQQTKGEGNPQEAQAPAAPTPPATQATQQVPTPEEPPEDPVEDGTRVAAPPPQPKQKEQAAPPPQTAAPQAVAQTGSAGAADVEGATQQQQAQTIAQEQEEAERLRAYVKALTKKVQENLVYPDAGRKAGLKGTASVSFKLLADGSIDPSSLHIATTSSQPQLDASALKTVQASAPFDPPPRSITIAISVVYGKVAASARK